MGVCWCKGKGPEEGDVYGLPSEPRVGTPVVVEHSRPRSNKGVDPRLVDQLVMEMLGLIASIVDNDEESPVALVKLHVIADKEEGWIQVVTSMVNVIPLEDPFGPSVITILLDDCALPSKDSVIKVTEILELSPARACCEKINVRVERNICVILGCLADKLAGPNSVAVLTRNTLEYLIAFLVSGTDKRKDVNAVTRREACVVLFALLALEKFAHTTENKLTIKRCLEQEPENPLLVLERLSGSEDPVWRQVGFCAEWALDNLFIVDGRKLSYEVVDMSSINVILNSNDVSEYLKISCNGLEARCDSYSFESVRCTFQMNPSININKINHTGDIIAMKRKKITVEVPHETVQGDLSDIAQAKRRMVDEGCWYYEVVVVTPGVMQIGWATKNSHFLNHEGYGIGDDLYSLSYDGCRKLIWYKARSEPVTALPEWRPGDVLGCLIDLTTTKEVIFSLNGHRLPPCQEIFETTRQGFFAAASFMAFQQCRFNFGHEPFRYPPTDRPFSSFNQFGDLTDDEKKVVPRRIYLEQLRFSSVKEDSCTLCFDDTACCVLEPCGHRGFCSVCTSQLKECPMCRAAILNIRREET